MKVAPSDVKYMVIGVQKVRGVPVVGILSKDHDTRQSAMDKMPIASAYSHLARVEGYVSNNRRQDHPTAK